MAVSQDGSSGGAGKPVIGVAGGIGSGKSTVARLLGELGAAVISADELNREELVQPEVVETLRRWWGKHAIQADGRPDREAIRGIITKDPSQRRRLEELMHPRIARRRDELMARYTADPGVRAVVWDAPLLFEAGYDKDCDRIIFVDADEETRRERVSRERGWTPECLAALEQSQQPLDWKRSKADYTVDNGSSIEDLRRQLADVFSQILTGV